VQGKTDHVQSLQERVRVLEGDTQEKRQLQQENDILRNEAAVTTKEISRLRAENVDLLGRLDLHLKDIPAEFQEAFVGPLEREKEEFRRAVDRHLQTVKRLEAEAVETKVELADLQGHLTAAYDNEKELQRKVVTLTLQNEKREALEAELEASKVQMAGLQTSESLTQQRLEMTNQDLASVKDHLSSAQEDLKSERERKETLEKVLKEVTTLETLGENVQKLQTSLRSAGLGVDV